VAAAERGAGRELPLRIRVVRPPAGVALGIQRGADEWLPPVSVSADAAVLEATVRVAADGAGAPPRVLGALAHGPPRARFVYVTWGRRAGQPESPWDRRAKVPLAGITAPLVGEALATRGRRARGEHRRHRPRRRPGLRERRAARRRVARGGGLTEQGAVSRGHRRASDPGSLPASSA
jgi:hypothetical protein